MARVKVQKGHEKERTLPPLFKLFITFGGILLISITQNKLIITAYAAVILLYLSTWPPIDILGIIKTSLSAILISVLILAPSVVMNHSLLVNELFIVIKVFLCVTSITIFNHTTQWNHVTKALRGIHLPSIFVFTIDITLKYIVLLGNLIEDLLTSYKLRSIGKENKKYQSIGGVMGLTFIKGTLMNKEMYEAMKCRCFSDDYNGL